MSPQSTTIRSALEGRPWLQAGLLFLAATALLWPGLDAGFIWDDTQQIVDSPLIGDGRAPLRFFGLNVVESWGSSGRGGDGVDTYRPVFFCALWLVHQIAGPDPFVFHLAVTIAHLGVCLLVWILARRWVSPGWTAAAVFAVFAIHPVTTEAYLWVSAISEPLSVAGLLAACLILDRWCRDARAPVAAITAAGLAMLAGLLSKEAVATALPVLSWFLWRIRGVSLRALAGPWIGVAVYAVLRLQALDGLQATGGGAAHRLDALENLPLLVLDSLRALVALQPVGVRHLYWDYREATTSAALAAAAVVAIACIAAWLLRKRLPLTATALGVLICMLVPVALIASAPGWGGFGRYLYLPLAFLALAGAQAIHAAMDRVPAVGVRRVLTAAVGLFIGLELIGLRHALEVYHSQEQLARTSVELQPHAPDGWEWLGNHYVAVGDLPNAARCFAEAVAIEPGIERPRHNLAAALLHLGRPAEALAHAEAVASMHGVSAEGAAVAATAAMDLERWDEARRWLDRGLERAPDNRRLSEAAAELDRRHPAVPGNAPAADTGSQSSR